MIPVTANKTSDKVNQFNSDIGISALTAIIIPDTIRNARPGNVNT